MQKTLRPGAPLYADGPRGFSEAAGPALEAARSLVLGRRLLLVAHRRLTASMELVGALDVSEHPSRTFREDQRVGMSRVCREDVVGVPRSFAGASRVEQHAREVHAQRQVVR